MRGKASVVMPLKCRIKCVRIFCWKWTTQRRIDCNAIQTNRKRFELKVCKHLESWELQGAKPLVIEPIFSFLHSSTSIDSPPLPTVNATMNGDPCYNVFSWCVQLQFSLWIDCRRLVIAIFDIPVSSPIKTPPSNSFRTCTSYRFDQFNSKTFFIAFQRKTQMRKSIDRIT